MLISCPDGPGIVAAVSHFLYQHGANIVQSDQYTMDPDGGMFFMRVEFDLPKLNERLEEVRTIFGGVAERFKMNWQIFNVSHKKRLAIFVSKEDHCLVELLWQWQAGDLDADIALVVSNHTDMQAYVESFGIPFHHIPVTADTKEAAEKRQLEVIGDDIDVIILARYMQIISLRSSSITGTGLSISTTRSCRHSSVASRTLRRISAGSRLSALLPTM